MTGLAALLETALPKLQQITEDEVARKPAPQRWSKKEILGHLIDSASNNHQRFVRAQLTPHLDFPEYEQEGWVRVQSYAAEPWPDLVALWSEYNRHLIHILNAIPPAALAHQLSIGGQPALTLSAVMEGYVRHVEHHLAQISSS